MSKYTVKDFNYISSGKKSKIINIDIESEDKKDIQKGISFVCGIENNDTTMDYNLNYNKYSLFDVKTNNIIHNLYDIKDLCLKSDIKKSVILSSSFEGYKSENYIDIYGPQLTENPIEFTQIGQNTYCLTKQTSEGPFFRQTTLEESHENTSDIIDSTYSYFIENEKLRTYTYKSNDYAVLSDNFQTRINLDGIKYNYMFEIPLNNEVNDFESGDVHADIFQNKNVYDPYYSMDMDGTTSIKNCREYCGVGNGCGTLYLKYYDNQKYYGQYLNEENNISNYSMTQEKEKYDFQKIETMTSINRFRNNIRHKSNLFSLELRDTGLNSVQNENVDKIKQDIKNNIREMVKHTSPANTQLFDIFFSGV